MSTIRVSIAWLALAILLPVLVIETASEVTTKTLKKDERLQQPKSMLLPKAKANLPIPVKKGNEAAIGMKVTTPKKVFIPRKPSATKKPSNTRKPAITNKPAVTVATTKVMTTLAKAILTMSFLKTTPVKPATSTFTPSKAVIKDLITTKTLQTSHETKKHFEHTSMISDQTISTLTAQSVTETSQQSKEMQRSSKTLEHSKIMEPSRKYEDFIRSTAFTTVAAKHIEPDIIVSNTTENVELTGIYEQASGKTESITTDIPAKKSINITIEPTEDVTDSTTIVEPKTEVVTLTFKTVEEIESTTANEIKIVAIDSAQAIERTSKTFPVAESATTDESTTVIAQSSSTFAKTNSSEAKDETELTISIKPSSEFTEFATTTHSFSDVAKSSTTTTTDTLDEDTSELSTDRWETNKTLVSPQDTTENNFSEHEPSKEATTPQITSELISSHVTWSPTDPNTPRPATTATVRATAKMTTSTTRVSFVSTTKVQETPRAGMSNTACDCRSQQTCNDISEQCCQICHRYHMANAGHRPLPCAMFITVAFLFYIIRFYVNISITDTTFKSLFKEN